MSKKETVLAMLADWSTTTDLMAATGWQAHTMRGALSTLGKKHSLTIERRRIAGVTSYRIKPEEYDAESDIRASVNLGLQTVKGDAA